MIAARSFLSSDPVADARVESVESVEPAGLAGFQDAFFAALLDAAPPADGPAPLAALLRQPGFAVYRNTALRGCIDALHANFPATARVVGDEWFRAAAAIHVRAGFPRQTTLVDYGADFPAFLDEFEPARDIAWLADVARVDRLWTEVHVAADAEPLDPTVLAGLAPDDLLRVALRPHPAARWAWFDGRPVFTLWRRNRFDPDAAGDPLDWRGEGVLLTRPHGRFGGVEAVPLGRGACAFVDACAAGASVAAAADAALAADAGADLAAAIAALLQAAAFTRCESLPDTGDPR
jgi:hypothetical protein